MARHACWPRSSRQIRNLVDTAVVGDKTIRNWEKELRGITDEGMRQRWAMARDFEASAMTKGIGRYPKAARMWREKRHQVEAELDRRGLQP